MSFHLQPTGADTWQVVFTGEPEYVHVLKMAPEVREPELDSGVWLIVAFPVWSGPARHSVVAAVGCAKDFAGRFQLGVRPFEDHEEVRTWWPGPPPDKAEVLIEARGDSSRRELHITSDHSVIPIWLVLRGGQVVYQRAGPRSREQLGELMAQHV